MYKLNPAMQMANGLALDGLARDPEVIRAYTSDPLVHNKISARLALDMLQAGEWALAHAAELPLPVLLVHGTADKLTSAAASQEFAVKAGANCTLRLWQGFYHETHNEPEKAEVLADIVAIGWRSGFEQNEGCFGYFAAENTPPANHRGVKMSLLITHGQVFTLGHRNELISDGALYIEGDTITDIGSTAALAARYPAAEKLDAGGKLVLPASICGHTHFYGAFARGMAIPGVPATNFVEILERLWWKLDRALLWDDVRYSALVCLVDAIRHGCTTLIDHHASPNAIEGSLDIIADAVKQTGLRASLCYEVTDRNGKAGAKAGIAENVRFIKRCRQARDPQLAASFGLHAAFTVSNDTLEDSRDAVEGLNTGFHIHVAEDKADEDYSLREYNQRVIERLNKFGILGPRSIAVHCVHLDEFEKDILHETRTWVTHQPRSNMNNAVGLPDVAGMLRRDQSRVGQRRLLQQHVRGDEGGLSGAQTQPAQPAGHARRRRLANGL